MSSIAEEKQLLELIKEREKIEGRIGNLKKGPQRATIEKLLAIEKDILAIQAKQTKETAAKQKIKAKSVSLDQKLLKLGKSSTGQILESFGLMKGLTKSTEEAGKATGKLKEGYNLASQAQLTAIEELKAGTFDAENYVQNTKDELLALGDEGAKAFAKMEDELEAFVKTANETPDLGEKLKIEADAQQKIEDFKDKIKETSSLLSSPKAMGVAAVGLLVKLFADAFENAKAIRQELGLSVGESAAVGAKITVAQKAMTLMGGDASQVASFASSISQEFGNISEFSTTTALQFAKISSFTGLSGASAAKLAKSIQVIQGGSLETSLSMISTFESMARTAGVSSKIVLEDIANNTETFAQFAKDGGKNIGLAAVQARKLGLELGTVAGIAEKLLDFESSIESSMQASVLLGRQVNTDKARELALAGDLEGLAKEIKNQVGSQAEFEAMNVVQRKALAEAMGVTVSDLGKIVAGEKTSAQIEEEAAKKKEASLSKQQGLEMALAGATASAAVAQAAASVFGIFGSFSKIPFGLGIPLGLAAVASMFTLAKGAKSAVGLETGGEVKETGMAKVHKGEVFSGTKNEMGFGANMAETNKILKETLTESRKLRSQNQALMNTLTNKVTELSLNS